MSTPVPPDNDSTPAASDAAGGAVTPVPDPAATADGPGAKRRGWPWRRHPEPAAEPQPEHLGSRLAVYPLQAVDPPKIGPFWLASRLVATPSGVAYVGYVARGADPVMMILLSQGAADDPAARDRLAGQIRQMDIDTVIASSGLEPDTGDDTPEQPAGSTAADLVVPPPTASVPMTAAPWVALAFDQTQRAVDEARRILAEVDLSWLPQQGQPAGPDYRLHWTDRSNPGPTRIWPLPWPGRHDRGGRLSILASWLLMLLLAATAVLIAILIFSRAPLTTPPPPIPTAGSGTGTSTQQSSASATATSSASSSPSPNTASPSGTGSPNLSASPSPNPTPSPSASPASPSPTPSNSGSPSPEPTAPTNSASPGGSPTPPSRL